MPQHHILENKHHRYLLKQHLLAMLLIILFIFVMNLTIFRKIALLICIVYFCIKLFLFLWDASFTLVNYYNQWGWMMSCNCKNSYFSITVNELFVTSKDYCHANCHIHQHTHKHALNMDFLFWKQTVLC